MPPRKRRNLIKCKLKGSPERWVKRCLEFFRGVGEYNPTVESTEPQEDDLYEVLTILSLNHLQYDTDVRSSDFLDPGFDVGVELFCRFWRDQTNRQKRDTDWWKPFRNSLLLGLLAERWDELDGICQWVQADLDPGYIGETKADYIFVKVILSVAAGLRESKMRALASMEKKIIDSRMPGPVALFEAWDAARNNDQAGFEKGMTTALKQFSAQRGERFVVLEWIALHESIVNLAARRLGLKHPELPPELDAYLMTPETIENN